MQCTRRRRDKLAGQKDDNSGQGTRAMSTHALSTGYPSLSTSMQELGATEKSVQALAAERGGIAQLFVSTRWQPSYQPARVSGRRVGRRGTPAGCRRRAYRTFGKQILHGEGAQRSRPRIT